MIQTVVEGIPIVNCYVPQGYSISSEKYAFKLAWFRRLRAYFEASLKPDEPAIWIGDLNVAPEPIDVYHPDKRVNDPDFHIDARMAYKETAAWGFIDVFRKLHPDACSTHTGISFETLLSGTSAGASITYWLRRLGRTMPHRGSGHGRSRSERGVRPHSCLGRIRIT